MFHKIKKLGFNKIGIVPKWIILLMDIIVVFCSFLISLIIEGFIDNFNLNFLNIGKTLILYFVINIIVFKSFKTYSGIIRYTGIQDAVKIVLAVVLSSFLFQISSFFLNGWLKILIVDGFVILFNAVLSIVSLLTYRAAVKILFSHTRNYNVSKKTVVIFGAGDIGIATKRVLEYDSQYNVEILAFVDDNPKKSSKNIDGIPIIRFSEFEDLSNAKIVDEFIIASFSLTVQRKNEIVDFCLNQNIKVLNIPPLEKWNEGVFIAKQIQNVNIEDLLEREPINIDNDKILGQITNQVVLVTGAAGSIGSEIVRQLILFNPELIILCDQAETPLHNFELELCEKETNVKFEYYLVDITNERRMSNLFEQYKPRYVYHAAAYKHVPMMEVCPSEAILNNVFGSKIIADLSIKFAVSRFVMVSTDKAVNPTNVMGASKRLAEIYIQGLSNIEHIQTKFITTRFGNVLGSNGSVINRFKDQILKGGPVTVTHPNITRYFMTIPEACQLVLEAGSMGNGGEIFVFDMGQPVTISELAKKMIRLYGFTPDIDIQILFTGLRPGEKLYEELLSDTENTIKTYHEKIMIAKMRNVNFSEIEEKFIQFESFIYKNDGNMGLVALMKQLIPEYKSENSIYECLDIIQD